MTPTEVALFACNTFNNKELEQLQPLVPKKSYDRLIRKSTKNPEELTSFIKSVDCTFTQTECISKKKVDMTRVSFEAFAATKIFKIEDKYQYQWKDKEYEKVNRFNINSARSVRLFIIKR